jgi:acetyl esterase
VLAQWPIYPAADPATRYPSYDLYCEDHLLSHSSMVWFDQCYRGNKKDWRCSPLKADQAGLPPTLIVTAGLDPLRDQGRAYAAACVQAGVDTVYIEAKGTIHGFVCLRKALPSGDEDIRRCTAVLKLLIEGSAQ